jgi:hypothetical protein
MKVILILIRGITKPLPRVWKLKREALKYEFGNSIYFMLLGNFPALAKVNS